MSSRKRRGEDSPPSMFSLEELLAKPSLRKELGGHSETSAGTSPSCTPDSSCCCTSNLKPLYGKTSQASSTPRITPSDASSPPWSGLNSPSFRSEDGTAVAWLLDLYEPPRGASWTPNTSDCPRDAKDSSLSRVLEKGPIPQKFFLSPMAAAGILKRAEKRQRTLPKALKSALEKLSSCQSPSPQRMTGETLGQ